MPSDLSLLPDVRPLMTGLGFGKSRRWHINQVRS